MIKLKKITIVLLILNRLLDYRSRLCRWKTSSDQTIQTFYNQALNTLYNYEVRSFDTSKTIMKIKANKINVV